jgi:1,4-alpha-glucan branching enzyme
MRKLYLLLLLFPVCSWAQTVSLSPTITPTLFRYNDQITVTYDVTGTPLATLTEAWAWVWIPGVSIDAKYNINPATAAADAAKFTKTTPSGKVIFTLAFKPSDFFTGDISSQTKIGILLKAQSWCNAPTVCQTTDYLVDFWDGSFQVALISPQQQPLFVDTGDDIEISAETPIAADYDLFINDVLIDEQDNITVYNYTHTVTEISGYATVELVVTEGTGSDDVTFQYIISSSSPSVTRPTGIIPGINYNSSDPTKVTLCLLAPGKSSVYVRGDFSEWSVLPENQMKKDGEFFWLEIDGLTAGVEYAYQYLVDETLWLADPYADKILDPDDQYIPETTYPNLKDFPQDAYNSESKWYFNRLAVFQTAQTPYVWQVTDFEKPAKEKLVVYEMLLRDFFEDGDNHYQTLIDTISYFKTLGITAIELMPIMEFGGNNSWGYNPQFMFAPDKAYGPKNKFKEFVDVCHQNGIAVILDIALNHQDMPNPYLLMDFNYSTFKANPTNKWFNVNATHPFSVFFDMNHESSYTKDYLDTINYYWLNEYKIDGYRFDLSKGFTQVNNPNNVEAWSAYDASRIAILTRMADKIWENFPDAYVILEHLAVNSEEKVLAEYRAGEGKGMLLWGNLNHAYGQSAMGYSQDSDVSWIYHGNRGWSVPHVVGYMESHDEERMIFRTTNYGNSSGSYNTKELSTGLKRAKAAATFFYTIPGPKMLWQFGELGYDYAINYCEDTGTISNECRTYPKPVKWDYRDDYERYRLYTHISDLNRLRGEYDIFTSGTATLPSTTELERQLILKNVPYTPTPANASEMNAVIVVNFDVIQKSLFVEFPHAGTWYEYYGYGTELAVTSTPQAVTLPPGAFKLYTDVEITNPVVTALNSELQSDIKLYPNPVQNILRLASDVQVIEVTLRTLQGVTIHPTRLSQETWDVGSLASGLYIVDVRTTSGLYKIKMIKNQ